MDKYNSFMCLFHSNKYVTEMNPYHNGLKNDRKASAIILNK